MYVPKQFQNTDGDSITSFIKANGFGILVSQYEGKMTATHVPFEFSADNSKLIGHIARANPQWKRFNDVSEVMVIFNGPHAYVSSSWYDHENVPTWNYIAVHVYGKIEIIEGDKLLKSLEGLVDKYEKDSKNPVSVDKMSPEFLQQSIRGLVGFEITINSIEAAYKLSQNRDQKNFKNIVHELEKRQDPASNMIALEMKKSEKGSHLYQ